MYKRKMTQNIEAIISTHWERRLFDSLIPLPDGTSYNAYLVKGSEKTALIDSTDPELREELLTPLKDVGKIDYLVSHHTEQDHSGVLPDLLELYPEAKLLCSKKAEELLITHLAIPRERLQIVEDGETVSLGNLTLKFIYTPWVHWPETMVTYVPEERCLFSCDLFGSHLATTDLFAVDKPRVYEAAKRYYAEIMMPFRKIIQKNMEKLAEYPVSMIAPSHGPIHAEPEFILEAYRDWVSTKVKNEVVLPYTSMHGSTGKMVKYLTEALMREGVTVYPFELTVTDIGKLAIALVDAATLIVATPTVHIGPHPVVQYAAFLANMLRPKIKYGAILASYAWGSKAIEQLSTQVSSLKLEVLGTILQQGLPTAETYAELDKLAAAVANAHRNDPDVLK